MTQEEQDVYALMGVTPLKKLERDFKNEKSVIINVVPPGEDEDEDSISESESYQADSDSKEGENKQCR